MNANGQGDIDRPRLGAGAKLRHSVDCHGVRNNNVGRRCEREKPTLHDFAINRFLVTGVGADAHTSDGRQ
jgi:hypothetical protein